MNERDNLACANAILFTLAMVMLCAIAALIVAGTIISEVP